jgi:hypothetical protein
MQYPRIAGVAPGITLVTSVEPTGAGSDFILFAEQQGDYRFSAA